VLFLFVAGEEQGLLGSKYYSAHPTFAPGRIAANINYDGGNFLGRTRDLTQVGAASRRWTRWPGRWSKAKGRRLVPDQNPDKGYYYRSDQFAFAKIGVPALYFDEGTDYIGKPAGWGKQQHDAVDRAHLPPAQRPAHRCVGVRRDDRGRHDRLRRRLAHRPGRRDANLEQGRRVRGRAQEGAGGALMGTFLDS
jgi:hypothetical protein